MKKSGCRLSVGYFRGRKGVCDGCSLTRQMGQTYSGSTSASAMCEELMEMLRRSRTSIIVALFAEKAFFSSSVAPLGGCASRTSPATTEAQPFGHPMHPKEQGSIDVRTGVRCKTVSAVVFMTQVPVKMPQNGPQTSRKKLGEEHA